MDFDEWWDERVREASTVIVILFAASFIALAVLRHWVPSGLLYLFLRDLAHQILFYVGGVLALVETLMLRWLNTPLEKKLFTGLALGCIFIASFQAWIDEHHNVEQLISDKSQIAGEREFWKGQSYAKDEAIRTRDSLLAQNSTALFGTQSSLAQLSNRILDVTKPEPRIITSLPLGVSKNTQTNEGSYMEAVLLLVNRVVVPVHMLVTCDKPIVAAGGIIVGNKTILLGDLWGGQRSDRSWGITTGGHVWSPTAPLVVSLYFNDNNERQCSYDEQ